MEQTGLPQYTRPRQNKASSVVLPCRTLATVVLFDNSQGRLEAAEAADGQCGCTLAHASLRLCKGEGRIKHTRASTSCKHQEVSPQGQLHQQKLLCCQSSRKKNAASLFSADNSERKFIKSLKHLCQPSTSLALPRDRAFSAMQPALSRLCSRDVPGPAGCVPEATLL